jgi:hypothetical protein
MNDNERAAREWDRAPERLAADRTDTAYAIALRHGAGARGLIWNWGSGRRRPGPSGSGPAVAAELR